ncbi:MAG TPA: rhomboid family intramembrane serine protease [Stellaceae bacterium]|nr:rhomboid family intramembrane serine protease [Stellaceae bacterium]
MLFFLPLYDDNPTGRLPYVTYGLIGLCAVVFLWQLGQDDDAVATAYGMIPAVLFGSARLAPDIAVIPAWMTVFTSMFLHGGWLHLGGNMLFLWIFGNNIEDVLGHARYLLLYLVSGVVAALCQALPDTASTVPMIGASGAIAGVLGAYLLLYPFAKVHVLIWIIIFVRIIAVPAWILLGIWFGLQLLDGLLSDPGDSGVAFWAHVGGFVSGVALLVLLRPPGTTLLQPPRSPSFAATAPRYFSGRDTFHSAGSDADAGKYRPRGPWDTLG